MDVMEIRRGIIAGQDQFIPPEYQKYDYIEKQQSSAYIDTGISGNDSSLRFVFDFAVTSWANYGGIFGNYIDENTRCWRIISMASTSTYYKRGLYATMQNSRAGASTSFTISAGDGTNKKVHIEMSYGEVKVKTDERDNTYTQTTDTSYQPSSRTLAIGSSTPTGSGAVLCKFYNFQIYRGDTIIRNFVPVVRKTDNRAGYYDTVNHAFTSSTGSAQFIAGND